MSSTASAAYGRPGRTPALTAVVGGGPRENRNIVRLVRDAGFGICAEPQAGALIVVIGHARESIRLRAIRELAEAHPSAAILAIVRADVPNTALRRVLLAGATGIVLDEDVPHALAPTARAVLAGQLTVPTVLGRQIAPRPLSHREKQILSLLVLGMTNCEIALKLHIAESTVKTHLSSVFRKIDARSRSEAVARIQDPEGGYGPVLLAVAGGAAG
jgi:DNA-binding NarL/FixJ family response regulator